MDLIAQFLDEKLRQSTKASAVVCCQVAARIADEVERICTESQRIQDSGKVDVWARTLAEHRLHQCLNYYNRGSHRGRIELQSTLSAIVYRYISLRQGSSSYQARLTLIEDFLQGFYAETLNAFRREARLPPQYSPRSLLELSEYMAFTERYAKRRITLSRNRSQQLIILRAQTFSQQQPAESLVDLISAESASSPEGQEWEGVAMQQLRSYMVEQGNDPDLQNENIREAVVQELIDYLKDKQQNDCVDYFTLRLKDCSTSEIETILGLTARQRDYLQQRFKYHLIRFALSYKWELVHQWLGASLNQNLGLTPKEWQELDTKLTSDQRNILQLKQRERSPEEIAKEMDLSLAQVDKLWIKVLELAWDIRNQSCLVGTEH